MLPFAYAGSGRGSFVRTKDAYQLYAGVKESGFEKAAEALLAEAERISRFGFTQTELDRLRTNYLRSLEQAYAERAKTNSGVFAGQYVGAALSGGPIIGIANQQALAKQLLPTITLAEVNALARSSFTTGNRVVLVAAPAKSDVKMPTAKALLAVFDKAKGAKLAAFVDSTSDSPLVPTPPAPGKVVSERTLEGTDILEWKLSNGARVLLKPTDFKADEVLFSAHSPGGASLLARQGRHQRGPEQRGARRQRRRPVQPDHARQEAHGQARRRSARRSTSRTRRSADPHRRRISRRCSSSRGCA